MYENCQVSSISSIISDDEFNKCMESLGPFESSPEIAVAVSGGSDSLCLAILSNRWVKKRGGKLHVLTVDHKLRKESEVEARQVGNWLRSYNMSHEIIEWDGPYPRSGIQAAARIARYKILEEFCRNKNILHLLVGHHQNDQAETVLIRQEGSSGSNGLAAMAAIYEKKDVRILRPFLKISKPRLVATLEALDQKWVDDPSNMNTKTARGRLRAEIKESILDKALVLAQNSASIRIKGEIETARIAARALSFNPAAFIKIDLDQLDAANTQNLERVLSKTIMTVAARYYPPRLRQIKSLVKNLINDSEFHDCTLAGCRILGQKRNIYVIRELARLGPDMILRDRKETLWDNRFIISTKQDLTLDLRIAAVHKAGWAQIISDDSNLKQTLIPFEARLSLPSIWYGDTVVAVPHLGYKKKIKALDKVNFSIRWAPPSAMASAKFGRV
ncbi:MAG: tRNA lysidine(34) synthetase TilS [Alphaproteobacteria bacterium]|nr:tRNA lysidine(34) synthetase TilS [Alphaproteobacteria bacterium]|tara:strand:+ start:734 stop:2068 length:1335 start_codon:yes stop_codon:yes gene_type:complete